jgi:hypothetical protein
MYNVTITFSTYSSYVSSKPTLAEACDDLAIMYAYYAAYDNRKGWITQICDTCTDGKVRRCPAPKRHRHTSHGDRCYTTCPTCKGRYETPVEG